MGIPEAELTPRIHEALTIIMGEFDNIRNELERAKEHVTNQKPISRGCPTGTISSPS